MIEFEVFSDDPEIQELVLKYWSTDINGKYIHRVADILPFRDISSSSKLISFITQESRAWSTDIRCSKCDDNRPVRSRSDMDILNSRSQYECDACFELRIQARKKREADENELLAVAINNASDSARRREIDYGQLPDDIAFIMLALERTICPKLIEGDFESKDLRFLINGSVIPLLKRLIDANAIASDPALAQPGAYWLKEGSLWYEMDKTRYFLVPDNTYGRSEDALAYLDNRSWDNKNLLRALWLDYALAECTTYFSDQCDLYSLHPNPDDVENITSQIRAALEHYSVSELWCAIWTIVKDAAALCKHQYFNVAKATATIPGKFRRLLEAVRKRTRQPLKTWDRPHLQPAGTLGELFYERFSVNEKTPGVLAMSIFSNPTPTIHDAFMQSDIVQSGFIDVLIEQIHHCKLGVQALSIFAAGIREGLSTESAVTNIIYELPQLQDDFNEES